MKRQCETCNRLLGVCQSRIKGTTCSLNLMSEEKALLPRRQKASRVKLWPKLVKQVWTNAMDVLSDLDTRHQYGPPSLCSVLYAVFIFLSIRFQNVVANRNEKRKHAVKVFFFLIFNVFIFSKDFVVNRALQKDEK